ncbi:glycosyltransferase [Paucibacter sp. DJ1R-11]|uniref:glycosyltransferase n=1 Tax=Paucibacter sp. DJ1R-11 TaxID=2893556 RepID=UPI0021E43C90|nr:glycosyltransferase [Paucibacter sp. DJ1R-11]MCV2365068.1 glycosyltransferase [Paucibacter sp. DJ1R-11]
MYDYLPAFRPDVTVLFGKELPKLGIESDLLGQLASGCSAAEAQAWSGGHVYLHGCERKGILGYLLRPFSDLALLWKIQSEHRLIQVRDKVRTGFIAWIMARLSGRKMVYWMSFPFVEGFRLRHREIGRSHGMLVWLVNGIRAAFARHVYYDFLAGRVDHLFVQSDAMLEFMAGKGVARECMTSVPMGVDVEVFSQVQAPLAIPKPLVQRRVIAYLGTLGKSRQSDFLLAVLKLVREQEPSVLLLMAGDGASADEQAWIRSQIQQENLEAHVCLTGWQTQAEILSLIKCAEIGLSPIPRNELFDVSSPTKAVEYLALGIPCVGNDIPDQKYVIEASGGGVCVPMEARLFADACLQLLREPDAAAAAGARGRAWVKDHRSYEAIAASVAAVYRGLLADKKSAT